VNSLSAATLAESTREHRRITTNVAARLVADQDRRPALLANMASGGVFVATTDPAAVGARVKLRFRLVSTLECEASGRVVWRSTAGEAGFGVAFESTNKHMASFTRGLSRVPDTLLTFYLADIIDPHIEID
jgi:Tfp pilus assembly protein PilZ